MNESDQELANGGGAIAAIVLAAGQSKRMGAANKVLLEIGGVPMIRKVIDSIESSGVSETLVVTGHERERVERSLSGCAVRFVFNNKYEDGMGTSLATGAKALSSESLAGILVCLGDLPRLTRSYY